MKKIIKLLAIILSFSLIATVVYASIAANRKSSKLPWQWTPSWYYDSEHNVWTSYVAEDRFTVSWEVVEDSVTGLMWQKNGNAAGSKTWNNAKNYCANLSLWWYSDWKLPNVKELESIVDFSKKNPSIETSKFTNTVSRYYWSSTTYSNGTGYAWGVYFYYGYSSYYSKTNYKYVRCVR